MKKYEVMYILKPMDVEKENTIANEFKSLLESMNAVVTKVDKWGKKRLDYEVQDLTEGLYILMSFAAEMPAVKELDRKMMIDENVLRHMIIRSGD